MKKAFSILLLATFLFNIGGYYFFFWAMKMHTTQELSAQIDDGLYNEEETFEIKIPISLPYPLQNNSFQRQAGEFEYQGKHYQLVKQKYENDTLTVVCLKDTKSSQINKVRDSFTEASNDQPTKGTANSFTVKVLQDYISVMTTSLNTVEGWSRIIQNTQYLNNISISSIATLSPPPRA